MASSICECCGKTRGQHRDRDGGCPKRKNKFSRVPMTIWHDAPDFVFKDSGKIKLSKEEKAQGLSQEESIKRRREIAKKLRFMI